MKLQLESFISGIANVLAPVELVMTQVYDYVKKKLISQLINGISTILQKLLNYFNGTAILTSFVLPSAGIHPVIFILDLNDSEPAKFAFSTSL